MANPNIIFKVVKPILLVKTPGNIPEEQSHYIGDYLEKVLGQDYYTIIFHANVEEFTFEVLNGENLDPVTIEELKAKLNHGL
jgi:hypothetical protein